MRGPSEEQVRAALAEQAARLRVARGFGYRRTFAVDPNARVLLPRAQEIVLADLRDYCLAERSTFDLDPGVAAVKAGRRDVWLRIQSHLNMTDEQISRLVEVERE